MSQVQTPDPVQTGAHAAKSREVFSKMIGLLGLKAEVKDNVNGNKIVLNVLTEEPGRLIGRNGVHLNSLSILMNNILRKDIENFPKVFIDVDGYGKGNNTPSEKRDQEQARREERRKERFEDRPERAPREERGPREDRGPRGDRPERGERRKDRPERTPAATPSNEATASEASPVTSEACTSDSAAAPCCDVTNTCAAPATTTENTTCAAPSDTTCSATEASATPLREVAPTAPADGDNAGPSRSFPSRNPGRRDREERGGDETRRDRFERRDDRGPRNDRGPRDDRGPRRDDRGPSFNREERPAFNDAPMSAESAAERLAVDCKNAAKEVKKWGDEVLLKPMNDEDARKAVQFFAGDAEIAASFDDSKRRVRVSLRTK